MPSLIATLGANISGFQASLRSASGFAQTEGQKIGGMFGGGFGRAIMSFAGVAGVEEMIRRTVEYGFQVQVTGKRLGLSTDAVQEFDQALKKQGGSLEESRVIFDKIAQSRDKALRGNADMVRAFKSLGVSVDDLKSKRLEDLVLQIGDLFKAGGDPQVLVGALRDIGGRGAGTMIPAMVSGLREAGQEAQKLGTVLDEMEVQSLARLKQTTVTFGQWMLAQTADVIEGWRLMARDLGNFVWGFGGGGGGSGYRGGAGMVQRGREQEGMAAAKANAEALYQEWVWGEALRDTEDETAETAKKRLETEKERLRLSIFKREDENALERLSKEQKITELYRRRAELARFILGTHDELQALKATEAQAEIQGEIQREEAVKEPTQKHQGPAIEKIGGFLGSGPQSQMLTLAQRSETHLARIESHLASGKQFTRTGEYEPLPKWWGPVKPMFD